MAITACICNEAFEPVGSHPSDLDIDIASDSDFGPLEARARTLSAPGVRCCIVWSRDTDGQVAYWGPQGATSEPFWY